MLFSWMVCKESLLGSGTDCKPMGGSVVYSQLCGCSHSTLNGSPHHAMGIMSWQSKIFTVLIPCQAILTVKHLLPPVELL